MESFTQKWAIIALLEDHQEGSEFHYTDTPLHVTLAGIFKIDKSGSELSAELAELLTGQPPVEIEASKRDMFGPDKDIPVMKIKKTPDLMALHQQIDEWLQHSGAVYNSPEYQGQGYLPHSTFQKSTSLSEGEKRILSSISLVDLYPDSDGYRRKISKTIDLLPSSS